MPKEMFSAINTTEDLTEFFRENFPDALAFMGEKYLAKQFFINPKSEMITTSCSKYHYKDRTLILGDAAHAMVNFYAQGLNCGFQDVTVFFDILDSAPTLQQALKTYSEQRYPDCVAISELSLYNYIEMRSLVRTPWFKFKRQVENFVFRYNLFGVVPLYEMVTFGTERYSTAKQKWERRENAWRHSLYAALTIVGAFIAYYVLS
jgi:kynurenine 3-monooxygenase